MVLKQIFMLSLPYPPSDILGFVGDPVLPRLYLGLNTGEISLYNISAPAVIRNDRVLDGNLIWDQPGGGQVLSGMALHPSPTRTVGVVAYMCVGSDIFSVRTLFDRNMYQKKCISGPEKVGSSGDFYNAGKHGKKPLGKNNVPLAGLNVTGTNLSAELSDVYYKSFLNEANGWIYYINNIDSTLNRIHGWAKNNPYCRKRRLKSTVKLDGQTATSPVQSIIVNELTDVIYVLSHSGQLTCLTGHPFSVYGFNLYEDFNAYDQVGTYSKMMGQRILQSYVNPRVNMLYVITQQLDNSYNLYFLDMSFPSLIYERAVWNFGPLEIFDMTFQNIISDFVAVGTGVVGGTNQSYIFLFNKFIFLSTLSLAVKPARMVCSLYDHCLYVQGTLNDNSVLAKFCGCDTGNGQVYIPGKTPNDFVYDPSAVTKNLKGPQKLVKAWHDGCA